jgi:hypothetical protein
VVEATSSRTRKILETGLSLFVGIPIVVAVVVTALGLRPDLDAALYRTVVVLTLLGAGTTLLELVYSQRRPATA